MRAHQGTAGRATRAVAGRLRFPALLVAALFPLTLGFLASAAEPSPSEPTCERIDGTVAHGEDFRASFLSDYELRLRPTPRPDEEPQGWTIQVFLPPDRDRDLSGYATPPVPSGDPRFIGTGHGLTAEAAVTWAEREFRFATGPSDHDVLATATEALLSPHDYAQQTLAEAQRAMERVPLGTGVLTIIGAHTRPPDEPFPRGLIECLEFEVELCLPDP